MDWFPYFRDLRHERVKINIYQPLKILTYLHTYLLIYLDTYLSAFLQTQQYNLPAYLPTYLPRYLSLYLHTNTEVSMPMVFDASSVCLTLIDAMDI